MLLHFTCLLPVFLTSVALPQVTQAAKLRPEVTEIISKIDVANSAWLEVQDRAEHWYLFPEQAQVRLAPASYI